MWLEIFLVAITLYILRHYYNSIRALFLTWNTIGPPSFPIIGSAFYFINKTPEEIFQITVDLTRQYGSFFKFWLGSKIKLTIQDPKDIEIVLSSMRYIDKATDYKFVRSWYNDGIILSTGKKWHDRRKIIAPAFNFHMLEKFTETFDRISNTFVEKLHEFKSDQTIELSYMFELFALDVICETALGVTINALTQPDLKFVKAIKEISHVFYVRLFNFAYRLPLLYKLSKLQKMEANALKVLHGFTDDIIRKRRQELTENAAVSEDALDEIGIRKKRVFLNILLHSSIDGKPLSDHDIREEVNGIISAGYDPAASAITFTLYNIAKYPEIQRKCFNEIVEVFGTDTKQPATLSLLNQLSYMELAIKESLRLFPSVPLIARTAMEDIKLSEPILILSEKVPSKNRIVPKGSTIVIPFFTIHRNPEYFEDPNEYKPERFLNVGLMEKKNPFTYNPFSSGPRACIGQKYAMYEIKCILSKILHNFEVCLNEDSIAHPVLTASIVLRPKSAIKFYLKRRT